MLPKEILKKVKLIEISTRKLVNNLFAGEYHTVFKGQGLTFSDFREYVPGDDIRSISWNLTAKAGKPYVKRYEEERELTLMLVVDISGSGQFGSRAYLKGEVLVQLAAVLAFAAVKNNDRIGLLLFSDHVEHVVLPRKGRSHVHRILRDLLYFEPKGRGTNIQGSLEKLNGLLHKKSTIFILSDFLSQGYGRVLRLLGRKHDVVAVVVEDPSEKEPPSMGIVDFEDAETGHIFTVDTSSREFRSSYHERYKRHIANRNKELMRSKVDLIMVDTTHGFVDPLVSFFTKRHKR